jgi:hypothetical protein
MNLIYHKIVKFFKITAAVLLGLILAEGFIRLMVPVEIFFETWFTPGIHRYDPHMGFVFTPYYRGFMRHEEGLWAGQPMALDGYGYRLPSRSPSVEAEKQLNGGNGAETKVLCLGGRSLMMSYGLPDAQTVPARLAAHSRVPIEAHNTGWAGDSLERTWHHFQRTLDKEHHYAFAFIAVVNPWLVPFANRYEFQLPPDNRPPEEIFKFMEGVFLWRSPLFHRYPKLSHRSYLGYAVFRQWDRWQNALAGRAGGQRREFGHLEASEAERDGFIRFLQYLQKELASRGTPSMVVFLPRHGFPVDRFDVLSEAFPASLPYVDLNKTMISDTRAEDFFAGDHYTAPMADRVGAALAELLSQQLQDAR